MLICGRSALYRLYDAKHSCVQKLRITADLDDASWATDLAPACDVKCDTKSETGHVDLGTESIQLLEVHTTSLC